MLRCQPFTAIIPVRGGSKGIPGKNLRQIGGQSLLERAIRFCKASPRFDRVIVTTDDIAMQSVAEAHGVASPSLRPAHLATDTATAADVVSHVIAECGIDRGYIGIVQVTTPLRRLADLADMCAAFETNDLRSAVSLVAIDEPRPEKMKRIDDGRLRPYMSVAHEGPRQLLPQPYRLNGAFYIISLDAFLAERHFILEDCMPFIMPEAHSHNLDSQTDWDILESMVAAGHWSLENHG